MAVISTVVDLRARFGPIRDQGPRPTCLSFAASDAHSAARNDLTPLACEYAFFHAQRRAKRLPTQGAVLGHILDALREDGQPEESAWPYMPANPDPATWSPPADVGTRYKRKGKPNGAAIDKIIADLAAGQPTVVLTKLVRSFFKPSVDGVVELAAGEQPNPAQRHAVIAVGHGTVDGKRAILVRNSWGPGWGLGGHAWLTETFLAPALMNTAVLLEEA
jgi:hypothetical protein